MDTTVPRMALLGLIAAFGVAPTHAAQDADPASTGVATSRPVAAEADDDPWSSPEIAAPRMDARPLERGHNAGGWAPTTKTADNGNSAAWLRTTMALGGVVGLIMLLAWGYRRVAGNGALGLALRARPTAMIEIVGRTALSPRQSVCLLRVGPRLVLVGCTPDSVRALDVVDDADLTARIVGQATQHRPDSHTAEFANCLEREAKGFEQDMADTYETVAPDEGRLAAIKNRLSGTIQRLRATVAET